MSGLDGLGHPELMSAHEAANTLKFVSDDHPCCAVALAPIIEWLDDSCEGFHPNSSAKRFLVTADQAENYAEALNDIADILSLPTGSTTADIIAACRALNESDITLHDALRRERQWINCKMELIRDFCRAALSDKD